MKEWIHMLCNRTVKFPKGTDPNAKNSPCPACGVALGGYAPA